MNCNTAWMSGMCNAKGKHTVVGKKSLKLTQLHSTFYVPKTA